MLEFRVFKFKIFTLAIIISMTVMVSLIGAETLLPLFMQNVLEFTPLESGLMLLPGAVVIGIMSPITGRLYDRYGAKWLALTGLGIVTVTTFMFTNLSLDTTFTYLTVIYAIRMFGLSMALMPVITSALNQLPPKWYSHASAMTNTMQQISAAIGTAMLITLVSMGANRFIHGEDMPQELAERAAQVVGFEWAFMGSTLLAFTAFILAMFMKRPKEEKEIIRKLHLVEPEPKN